MKTAQHVCLRIRRKDKFSSGSIRTLVYWHAQLDNNIQHLDIVMVPHNVKESYWYGEMGNDNFGPNSNPPVQFMFYRVSIFHAPIYLTVEADWIVQVGQVLTMVSHSGHISYQLVNN